MKRILIMGLPGSGKTTFAKELKEYISLYFTVEWFNADEIRKAHNDWDFSFEGRMRQADRMDDASKKSLADFVICDFVAPMPEMREKFKSDYIIWIDTVDNCEYENTNKIFTPPTIYDFRITEKDAKKWVQIIAPDILDYKKRKKFNWSKESALMLGRFQPWHKGHRALFIEAFEKTGQVIIQVRDCYTWKNTNPFTYEEVEKFIRRDLDPLYLGQYEIMKVPNIVEIVYGRDVGYKITKIDLPSNIESISATSIRKEMGLN